MKITTKSSSGEYYFTAFLRKDCWVVERKTYGWLGNTYSEVGTAYSRDGVLSLCVHHTPGNGAKVKSVS